MNPVHATGATARSRARLQLELALYRHGLLWPLAILLAAAAAAVYLSVAAPARAQQAETRAALSGRVAPVHAAPVAGAVEAASLDRLDSLLRPEGELDAEVRELYAVAQGARLPIGEAQFSASTDAESGLRRLLISLPVNARYVDVRGFIDASLAQLPNLSIDEIALSGSKGPGSALDVRLHLSLWGRPLDGVRRAYATRHAAQGG